MASRFNRARVVALLALAAGSSKRASAAKAGIAWSTFCSWQQKDTEFADAIEVASGHGRELYENLIRQHAEKDWRAAYALYESIYLDQARGRRGVLGDDLAATPAPDPVLAGMTDDEAEQRVGQVLAVLRKSLGSDEAVEEVIRDNVARLRLVQ